MVSSKATKHSDYHAKRLGPYPKSPRAVMSVVIRAGPLCLPEGFSVYTAAVSRVPPHASPGSDPPGEDELEQLEELGDDAIIAQQQGAHVPKPRAQVTEEARSIVISDHPSGGPNLPSAPKMPT